MKKYIPYALILAAFLAGSFLGDSSSDKELERKYREEQNAILEVIGQRDVKIMRLQADSAAIQRIRISDSLFYAGALERNHRAYTALKKKYNEINLNRATVPELDSIITALYP